MNQWDRKWEKRTLELWLVFWALVSGANKG